MTDMKKKGILYDLDGTIISTTYLHEQAWRVAADQLGLSVTPDFLSQQKGLPGDTAAALLPDIQKNLISQCVAIKEQYVLTHVSEVALYEGFVSTVQKLLQQGHIVGICTSALRVFTAEVFKRHSFLQQLEKQIITREMYQKGKPDPEPLMLAMKTLEIYPQETVYIGDAYSDYCAAQNASCLFIYFCPDLAHRDTQIPTSVITIQNHSEVLAHV